jgi:hypothetical protein
MLRLKNYLFEEEGKNLHMEHVEDLIFNEGVEGARKAIFFLRDLRDMLAGNSTKKVSATVKWDGAPAIFAGIDPEDGKFFVAKKGIFNKQAKLYKTAADVDADTSGDLAEKLKVALKEFAKLGIKKGVYQGDIMYTQSDLKKETIDGVSYITFHPNTIMYAVPYDSALGKKIRAAKIGVVWHTTYEGDEIKSMSASFGKSIVEKMTQVSSVWMDDANYKDYSGTATFTKAETDKVTEVLSRAGTLFRSISAQTLNAISQDADLMGNIKTFNNLKVRNSEKITDTKKHVKDLYHYIYDRYQGMIDRRATPAGKQKQEEARKKILSFFAHHDQNQIVAIFDMMNAIVEAKQLIINKMNSAGHISTFLRTNNGFTVTSVEGYVAIDHLTGGAVKIVDRMEFSRANFSADIVKGWQR